MNDHKGKIPLYRNQDIEIKNATGYFEENAVFQVKLDSLLLVFKLTFKHTTI